MHMSVKTQRYQCIYYDKFFRVVHLTREKALMVWYMGLWRGTVLRQRSSMRRQARPFSREARAEAGSSKHRKRTNGHYEEQNTSVIYPHISQIGETTPTPEHFECFLTTDQCDALTNLAMELRDTVPLGLVETHRGPHALIATVIATCPTWNKRKPKRVNLTGLNMQQ